MLFLVDAKKLDEQLNAIPAWEENVSWMETDGLAVFGSVFSFGTSSNPNITYTNAAPLGPSNRQPEGLYFMPTGKAGEAFFFQVYTVWHVSASVLARHSTYTTSCTPPPPGARTQFHEVAGIEYVLHALGKDPKIKDIHSHMQEVIVLHDATPDPANDDAAGATTFATVIKFCRSLCKPDSELKRPP